MVLKKNRSLKILAAICALGFLVFFISFSFFSPRSIAPYRHRIIMIPSTVDAEIISYEKKVSTNPGGQIVLASLADLYTKKAKLTGDVLLFKKAEFFAKRSLAALSFKNEKAKLILADIAQAQHKFSQSILLCREILDKKSDPKKSSKIEALSILITSLLAIGDLQQAHIFADQLIDLNPFISSSILHGLVMSAKGKSDEAVYDFKTAYAMEIFGDPNQATRLRAFWGRFYIKQGQYENARSLLEEALRISPHDPLTLGLLAELEIKTKNYVQAETNFKKAFSMTKQMIYVLGQIRVRTLKGDLVGADDLRFQIEKVIRNSLSQPNNYSHRSELIILLLDRGNEKDIQEALHLTNEEAKLRKNSDILFLLSKALFKSGQALNARAVMRDVLRSGAQDAEYFNLAANIENSLNNYSLSQFYLAQTKKLAPLSTINKTKPTWNLL